MTSDPTPPQTLSGELHSLSQRSKSHSRLVSSSESSANGNKVNASTRPLHAQLNRLILLKLPLALPPHSVDTSKYAFGLLHIAAIYMNFESLWQATLVKDFTRQVTHEPLWHVSRVKDALSKLYLPSLMRTERLRADIRALTHESEDIIDERINHVARAGNLAEFLAHTKQSVDQHPQILIAYAWVFYMALFSGGRYVRASLKAAGGFGKDFWDKEPPQNRHDVTTKDKPTRRSGDGSCRSAEAPFMPGSAYSHIDTRLSDGSLTTTPGLSFYDFVGLEDGEDIKFEFRNRFAEAELLLMPTEKDDIVNEAQHIFSFMLELVGQMDAAMRSSCEDRELSNLSDLPLEHVASASSTNVELSRVMLKAPVEKDFHQPTYLQYWFLQRLERLFHVKRAFQQMLLGYELEKNEVGGRCTPWVEPILATLALLVVWYVVS